MQKTGKLLVCMLSAAVFALPISAITGGMHHRNASEVIYHDDSDSNGNRNAGTRQFHSPATTIPPNHEVGYVRVGWRIREYLIHLPSGYSEHDAVPLVVTLHYYAGSAAEMVERAGISEKADEMGFIAVYPNGIQMLPAYLLENKEKPDRTWNAGFCCGPSLEYGIDDVAFVRAVIEQLQRRYNIDGDRIYVAGHSNGGIMAYRLAAELSDLVAAVASNAGTIGGQASAEGERWIIPHPAHPVSVIHFHGREDAALPYEGGLSFGYRYPDFMSVNESIGFWVRRNGCTPEADISVSESGHIIRAIYRNGDAGTDVVLYTDGCPRRALLVWGV